MNIRGFTNKKTTNPTRRLQASQTQPQPYVPKTSRKSRVPPAMVSSLRSFWSDASILIYVLKIWNVKSHLKSHFCDTSLSLDAVLRVDRASPTYIILEEDLSHLSLSLLLLVSVSLRDTGVIKPSNNRSIDTKVPQDLYRGNLQRETLILGIHQPPLTYQATAYRTNEGHYFFNKWVSLGNAVVGRILLWIWSIWIR